MEYKWHYKTPEEFDDMVMYSDGTCLTGLYFMKYLDKVEKADTAKEQFLDVFQETKRWLDHYFSGEEPDFIPSYRMTGLTTFRKEVVEEMRQIPYGETATYGEIAGRIGKKTGVSKMSAQAVGGAVGWNPIGLIVPCHRVMGAHGKLTGYGGGLENKKALLSLERKGRKKLLRKQVKEKAGKLSEEYCKRADERIVEKLISKKEYLGAKSVFCYVGTKQEIHTLPFLYDVLKRGKRLFVPKCLSYGIMEAVEIFSLDDLKPGTYGIFEPKDDCLSVKPEEIEFACIPCLSCSSDGRRLGYGGGFYDRYLPRMNCPKAVLCRKEMMREDIPVDSYDIVIEDVVTE